MVKVKSAKLYTPDGEIKDVRPANGEEFTQQELVQMVDDTHLIYSYFGQDDPERVMISGEYAKLKRLPINEKASKEWVQFYQEEYEADSEANFAGNVLICSTSFVGE